MCKDLSLDNQTTNIDIMNNVETDQSEITVSTGKEKEIDKSSQFSVQDKVLEMYNMLVGITSEIERIKVEIANRRFHILSQL